jgi:hypothetical protein
MKIIFLDIDGVLNCEVGFSKRASHGYCQRVSLPSMDSSYTSFYPPSKDLLNMLIEKTKAKIVISSSWRGSGLEWIREVWKAEGMSGEIIDITPNLRGLGLGEIRVNIPRGLEIEYWLNKNGYSDIYWSKELQQEYIDKSGIENYIILDDDGDMLWQQKEHFIHIPPSPRHKKGFSVKYYTEALRILSKSSTEINYKDETRS